MSRRWAIIAGVVTLVRVTLGVNLPDGRTARKTAEDLLSEARSSLGTRES